MIYQSQNIVHQWPQHRKISDFDEMDWREVFAQRVVVMKNIPKFL